MIFEIDFNVASIMILHLNHLILQYDQFYYLRNLADVVCITNCVSASNIIKNFLSICNVLHSNSTKIAHIRT